MAAILLPLLFLLLHPTRGENHPVRVLGLGDGTKSLGQPATLVCRTNHSAVLELQWVFDEKVLPPSKVKLDLKSPAKVQVAHEIKNVSLDDFGKYTCVANVSAGERLNATYQLLFNVEVKVTLKNVHEVKEGGNVSMVCSVVGHPSPSSIHWQFHGRPVVDPEHYQVAENRRNPGEISSTLSVISASRSLNGSYICLAAEWMEETHLVVKSKPEVLLRTVKAVGKTKIYANWTLFSGNSNVKKLELVYWDGKENVSVNLSGSLTSVLISNLIADKTYSNFTITAVNEVGPDSNVWKDPVVTLNYEPAFVPSVSANGFTSTTASLQWMAQPNVTDFFDFYNVSVRTKGGYQRFDTFHENPLMVEKLKPGVEYVFRVQACSSYVKWCDEFSEEVIGTTMDGLSSAPKNLKMLCQYDHKTHETLVTATWDEPSEPQGFVQEYEVVLTGNATFYDENGRMKEDRIGPIVKNVLHYSPRRIEFPGQPPNTQLFVHVCAKTRTRRCGAPVEETCVTPESIPDTQELSKAYWKAVQRRQESQQIYFMITVPHISQRNGTICCLRVIVVRLNKDQSVHDLKPPGEMEISSYDVVHNGSSSGAYVAEMLDPHSRNIMIGDGVFNELCQKCWAQDEYSMGAYSYRPSGHYPSFNSIDTKRHRKRHASSNVAHQSIPMASPKDGPLDAGSTYTAYIDAIVLTDTHQRLSSQSKYFNPLSPRVSQDSIVPGVAIISSLIVAFAAILITLMCVMRWRSKEPRDQEYGLSHSIQQWCRRLRGQQPIPSEEPPNLPLIMKEDLVAAYVERHKDSDLGFQQEFEKLPERFCDRTAHASENASNNGKNRYPDIKAYDQTRVKLSTSESNSDYINANYVVGYKERKKFVCAQGPMEATVNDWWRMIWEQHVHFILMLTNVEEYNKTKCAKYWPSEGSTNYADFTVTHSSEKRYSDYLVRNLRLTKARTANGANVEDGNKEEREIAQYHYLVWKDFMAPEHPVGILRFIKRFNEAYSTDKGPILVHCSAGVGRTGTLVALDSMLQQLNDEGCVSIFNTICDLRHQRNYLVQSLKQYIFIYRALMEYGQFGDTDVAVAELKSHIEKMKGCTEGKSVCRMQEEFERLVQVIEDRKPFTVGASEENRQRNRHENVVPYDRNRVHLSPMPNANKEINTYINATFIEGYDNTEQFIIAQDPLETTIGDFWRMIVEQNIRCIVMLSDEDRNPKEGEDNRCPRYWPEKDQETSHDYIKVKYMQSQSFPFYYSREFTVTDTKADHATLVTQFQYNGWPKGEGEVPQVDRGIVELIDTTFKYKDSLEGSSGPIVVHCSDGADRSCIFVALAILTQQMMNESRVDVFSVVRKLRSQRQGLFRNFPQYEFIYRGLHTYAELHVSNGNAGH